MTWSTDLLTGIAELLADAGIGVHRPDTPYQPGETAIVHGPLPETPDTVIALVARPISIGDGTSGVEYAIQVRTRAPEYWDVLQLSDRIRDVLDGLENTDIGGVPVANVWHQSGAWIGADTNARNETSDNYYLNAARATALRSD